MYIFEMEIMFLYILVVVVVVVVVVVALVIIILLTSISDPKVIVLPWGQHTSNINRETVVVVVVF